MLYNATPQTKDATGNVQKNPNPHYDADAVTNTNNLHYGNKDYTEKLYTDYTQDIKNTFSTRGMWWGYL
jgi:hypothetical protein